MHISNKVQKIIQLHEKNKTENIMKLYKSILSIIPEGIAVINSEKKLLYANSTLKKIIQSKKKQDIIQVLMNLGNNNPQVETNPGKQNINQQTQINVKSHFNLEKEKNNQDKCKKQSILNQNPAKKNSQQYSNLEINQCTAGQQQQAISSKQIKTQIKKNLILNFENTSQSCQQQGSNIKIQFQEQIQEAIQASMDSSSQSSIDNQSQQQNFNNKQEEKNKNLDPRTSIQIQRPCINNNNNQEGQNNIGLEQPKSFISFSNKKIVGLRRDSKQCVQRKSLFTRNNTNQSSIGNYQSDQSEILSYQGFGFNQEEQNQSYPKNLGFEIQYNSIACDSVSNKANLADSSTLRSKQMAIHRKSWKFYNSSLSALSPTINKRPIQQMQHSQPNIVDNLSEESKIQNNISSNIKKDSLSFSTNKARISQQTTCPFIMKVKTRKNQQLNQENSNISLAQTNISNIVDWMLSSGKDQQKNNQKNDNDIQNPNFCEKYNIPLNCASQRKSFLSHFQKQSQPNLSYIQQTDTLTKIQVKHKNKDLVLQFLRVDLLTENQKNDPLVLIMVQDLWQDLYKKKVQELQKDKMKLFASLSHELRTPLNCSISMLEVLKDEMSVNNQRYIDEYLNPALFSNKLLLNQINDILDFVQMDSGKFKYSFIDFDIVGLLKDCQKLISMQASMKNINIKVVIQKGVPERICSDPNRIRQILLNFLSNALKFTVKGYIEIGINPLGKNLYEIYVKDTGIGIMKDNLEKIFQFCNKINYNQNDESLNQQGCGLGLTISNSIANGLVSNNINEKGIKVQSEYGKGSTFSIVIQDMDFQVHSKQFIKDLVEISLNDLQVDKMNEQKNQEEEISPYKNNTSKRSSLQIKSLYKSKNVNQHQIHPSQVIIEDEMSQADQSNQSVDFLKNSFIQTQLDLQKSKRFEKVSIKQPIQIGNNHQIDSALIIEYDEENQQNIQIHSHISIKNNLEQYQDDENSSLEKQLTNNSNPQKIIKSQYKQLRVSKCKSPKKQQKSSNNIEFTEANDQLSNQNQDHIQSHKTSDHERVSTKYQNSKSDIESNFDFSKKSNINVFGSNNVKTTESFPQIDQQRSMIDQEGFTSYVGFSKFFEKQHSSKIFRQSTLNNDHTHKLQSSMAQQNKYIDNEHYEETQQKSFEQQEYKLSQQDIIDNIIETNKKKNCSCPQILIVDDNQFNLYALSKVAEQYHFRYTTASDGNLALQEIENIYQFNCCKAPKIIFMDIEMPFKDGYETAQEIIQFYKNVNLKQLPILIACTAYVGQEDQNRFFQVGMVDFINKPILKNAFQQLIINWSTLFI
ncbi:ATPase, histidine kinase-, DNA gyrase B (macronuclear) [Tetrahymena thermophila SB210]|uniref:histidine kinase n=1 Tax=Tetrahymena thermophila (strain SB210) TaxID=312017 RepID=Q23ED0_TETTS|nr:ATPase, histidine kinase-, DNA gyrase B [Tetrahymena thermophila SB210]EAR94823.2 ATPase, histidine kinase-, DNA gyrase B [Tetrahymena thermophila SB210]|eukprot:XP_001015068.2 ATPase, histidine kinase-, DNA gyrase B [Tetrahymena thermophila SB210]